MKKILFYIFFLLVGEINYLYAQSSFFNPFKGNVEEALIQANNKNKKVLIYFTAKWCGPCIEMQRYIFPKPSVRKFINKHFIFLERNIDSADGKLLKEKYLRGGIPAFCILDSMGNKQFIFYGYQPESIFIRLLNDGLAPEKTTLALYKQLFFSGEKNVDSLKKYLDTFEFYNDPLADSVYTVIVSVVDSSHMKSLYMINKMRRYLKSKNTPDYFYLLKNRKILSQLYGAEIIGALLLRPLEMDLENAAIKADTSTYTEIQRKIYNLDIDRNLTHNILYNNEKILLLKLKAYERFISLIESNKYASVFSNEEARKEDGAIAILFSNVNNEYLLNIAKRWIYESLEKERTSKKSSIAGQIEEKLGNNEEALFLYKKSIEQYIKENPSSSVPPGLESLVENVKAKISIGSKEK